MNMRVKAVLILVVCWVLSSVVAARDQKQVLLISSYNSRFPTYYQQIEGIKSVFDPANIRVDAECLDSKRFTGDEKTILFHKTLQYKLQHTEPYDAILVADDDALNFVIEYRIELFDRIPIVFFGVNNIEKALEYNHDPLVTGIVEAVSMKETMELMLQLFPSDNSLYCITDTTESGRSDLKLFRQTALQFPGIRCNEINLAQLTFDQYIHQLQKIPATTPVLLLSAYHDKNLATIDFDSTLTLLNRHLKAPLFHLWEHGFGEGILGGKVISHFAQGKTAAQRVVELLNGREPDSMPVDTNSPNVFIVDYAQLQKHGLQPNQLPEGTVVLNQPQNYWHKNKVLIIVGLSIMGLLIFLIIVLSANILKRKKYELQLREQNASILKLNNELLTAKEKAEEGELKFKQLFYDNSAIKILIDPVTGKIFDINHAAADFYGWSVEELRKMTISDLNILSSAEIKKEMETARHSGKVHFEFRHRKANGTIADVEVFSSMVVISGTQFLFSTVHDISRKKADEHQIRLLSRSVEQSPVAIVITDWSGIIEYVNPAFTSITGYTSIQAKGKNPNILKSGHTPESTYIELWETIYQGKTWMGELRNKKANGEYYWVSIAISPIYKNKELTNFVAVSEDITEKKRIVEDLIRAKNKAEESNKLKTEFLHNMSHEIRTPMNGIIGFSEILSDEQLDTTQRKLYTDIIIKSSYQLLNIIDDILEISQLETRQVNLNPEVFCVVQFIQELHLQFAAKMKEKGLEFTVNTPCVDEPVYIRTDKIKFNRIVISLIDNALKFTEKGSVEIGFSIENGQLKIYVKDTGIGISENYLERIFDRFEQEEKELSRKYGGIGLGLSISRENVRLLGGTISVESVKQAGSTFYVTLPYIPALAQPSAQASLPSPAIAHHFKTTILVAEDELINFLFLDTILKKNFDSTLEILHARNGQEAIDFCASNPDIDLVLMDINMPLLNGYDATRTIKFQHPHLPVIAVTAYSTEADKELALSYGFDEFLSKPVKKPELFNLVQKHLNRN